MTKDKDIKKAAKLLKEADAIIIISGAGMGVDSGLPDFRGNEGFWRAYPVAKRVGLGFEEMANPKRFETHPAFGWGFYGHRLNLYRNTTPHLGFQILLDIAKEKGDDSYFVYTSNVDGQFQMAGFREDRVCECHGSIHYLQCTTSESHGIWSANGAEVEVDEERLEAKEPLPRCPHCNEIARPNILMFGDWGFNSERLKEQRHRYKEWKSSKDKKRIVTIEIGAGIAIPTIRRFGETLLFSENIPLIRINKRESDGRSGTTSIEGGALEVLQKIKEAMDEL